MSHGLVVVVIMVLYFGIFTMANQALGGGEVDDFNLDESRIEESDPGFLDILVGFWDAFMGFLGLLWDAMTFNVEGAPAWLRFIISGLVIAPLAWELFDVVKGLIQAAIS